MDKPAFLQQKIAPGETPGYFDSVKTVEDILTKAKAYCSAKMGVTVTSVPELLKTSHTGAYSYFNYSIARQLGEVLGRVCKNVKAVYALDFAENIQEEKWHEIDQTIHIILRVERKTNSVAVLIDTLHDALIQQYKQLLGKDTLAYVLDAHLVDDEDIKSRTGYGALLGSVYQSPIHVWGEKLNNI